MLKVTGSTFYLNDKSSEIMGVWMHYIVAENKPVTMEDIEQALRQVSRKFYVDADMIVKKSDPDAEPDYD